MPASIVLSDLTLAAPDDGRPLLSNIDLSFGPERTGLVGRNGVGKTTLLRLISGELRPQAGTVSVTAVPCWQNQPLEAAGFFGSLLRELRINPHAEENACRAALARFMFRADAALAAVSSLSGGQLLRAGLACVLGGATPPSLLILDEPTNHLDTGSIEAVEAGLRAFDGALLVVSHDDTFLQAIGMSRRLELPSDMQVLPELRKRSDVGFGGFGGPRPSTAFGSEW
jgi:ATPase subunit of ABC transporter with duplicated ATPase domains